MKEIFIGILASLFFAVTFILNRSMELEGGSWLWSSSLRYFFMVPFLIAIVAIRGKNGFRILSNEMKESPVEWVGWSFIGFVLFYAPLTFAAAYGPGWLVSGTWQFTIVAGLLLAPLFLSTIDGKKVRAKIPLISLSISGIILIGIFMIQIPQAQTVSTKSLLLGTIPVIIAAFAYPLGNRKMMALCGGRVDPFQRVLGMTIASLPIWVLLAVYAFFTVGLPSASQLYQSLLVAVSSGVIATVLFFIATDRVRHDQGKLAAVEATQSIQVLFVVMGEMMLLNAPLPKPLALAGLAVIIIGLLIHSYHTVLVNRKRLQLKNENG
ncbi:multidrug resistance efflux transporter family protein [Solibacillus sp. FSL W8-0474]|uniref:DMT family transporter n=1 Tax=Solibacillus sp. FSL W8-0474 TaxID=2975336 RepID=UPI0030FC9283